MTRTILVLCALSLLPAAASAQDRCRHSEPRALALDIGTAKTVAFEIGNSTLRLDARPGRAGSVEGRACASSAALLEELDLTQERVGDRLVVRALREHRGSGLTWGNRYAHMELTASVPEGVDVAIDVGSGEARVAATRSLEAVVGSGDLEARGIRGAVAVKVGSGDITLDDIGGALHVRSIGSGDVTASGVRGDVRVGSIGSGDLELSATTGGVRIGSIGSGDADIRGVGGAVVVATIGSGDLDVRDVRGGLTVDAVGSGSVEHAAVAGTVDLPRKR